MEVRIGYLLGNVLCSKADIYNRANVRVRELDQLLFTITAFRANTHNYLVFLLALPQYSSLEWISPR